VLRRQRQLPTHLQVRAHEEEDVRAARLIQAVDLAGIPALELAELYRARACSPVEVIEAALARIEKLNPVVNAFVWLRREAALEEARAAEKRFSAEQPRRLEGVPFTAKDLTPIEDGPTNHASRAFEGRHEGYDAEIVRRLKADGAILIATTTASEFGHRPTTESALFGVTVNPWNTERTPGGSTGGGAVAAALGISPLNQGSDGGGSLRIPASCSGVFGLKPARGRIPLGPRRTEDWGGVSVYGPITRTVADAAMFLASTADDALAFLDAADEMAPRKIAVAYERDGEKVDPETLDKVDETAALLRSLGHTVEEAAPNLLPLEQPYLTVSTYGIGEVELTNEQWELLEPRTQFIIEDAREISTEECARAKDELHARAREALTFFDSYDALLTPTLSRPAPPIGEIGGDVRDAWNRSYRNWLCWTWPFNATGQPAASIPAGFSSDGLPIGVQIVGRPADERTVIALAAELERARPWIDHRPPIW
jgi:amidase